MALALAGCAAAPPTAAPHLPQAPALRVRGAQVYRIVPRRSELRIRVYRGGALADLGHDHVIVTSAIDGCIYLHRTLAASGFEARVALERFKVDPPAARREEGRAFAGTLTTDDRAGTRKHMLGPVLDAERYPWLKLRSLSVEGSSWDPRINVRVTLHGVSRDYVVPTAVVRQPGRLTAIGGLTLKQSDFGITPFSVLGGGLKVRDRLQLIFHFVAKPMAPTVSACRPSGSRQRGP